MSNSTEAVKQLDVGRCWYTDEDNGSKSITLTTASRGLQLVNDSAGDIVLTVNSLSFTIKAGEIFDEAFDTEFTAIDIVAVGLDWRLLVRV